MHACTYPPHLTSSLPKFPAFFLYIYIKALHLSLKHPPLLFSPFFSILSSHNIMGTCFSSTEMDSLSYSSTTATVISAAGTLRQYPLPINASQVLGLETTSPSSFFLCNSDQLFFDEHIPPLDSAQQLHVGHIYFVLPIARLQHPLAAREMAAMAVKASMALVEGAKKQKSRTRKRTQKISPLSDLGEKVLENEEEEKTEKDVMRPRSLKRVMSRKGKQVERKQKRPFIATLATIHEGFMAE